MNRFFKLYKFLFEEDKYKDIGLNSKVAYCVYRDLIGQNKNVKKDKGGKVYIENPRKYLMNTLNVSINTVTKIHKELNSVGLIKDVWDDVGKPNIVYIKYCETLKPQVIHKTYETPKVEEKKEEILEITENEEGANDGIKIANDVVAVIAGVAVSEVPGVASMSGGFAGGITEVLSGKKNLSKGIKVDADEKEVKIDVNIIVEYGSRIPDVAFEIQNRVKKSVENMTGLKVAEVNVHVQGVKTEKDEDDEKEIEKEDKE